MLKTLGIVQATFSSPAFRLNALRKLGGKSLLEWVIRRATDSMRLDGVIVVACDTLDHPSLCRYVPMDVPVFQCHTPDMLARFSLALEQYRAEAVVRIQGDNLFIDPALIDRLVFAAEAIGDCDYAGYGSHDGSPAALSPVSVYAEWFRSKALHRAHRLASDPDDRQQVTSFIYTRPKKFRVHWIPAPGEIDRDDVRLTIANDDDWDHALEIVDALGPDAFEWQRIAGFLSHQPAMRKRMAALNRAYAGS